MPKSILIYILISSDAKTYTNPFLNLFRGQKV